MSTFKTISEAEVLLAFPAAPAAITGDMTLRDLIRLILHLMHCSQAVKNDNHVLNYLYLACPDTFWANYSADAYPTTPAHPGNFPTFHAHATTADIANGRAAWEWQLKAHTDPGTMDRALVHRFLSLLPPDKKKEYENRKLSNPNEAYIQCLAWFSSRYGDTSEPEREENRNRMKADWNLHDGWQALQEQVEEGQLFAALTNAAISDVDAVDIAISVLMKTGMFEHAYEEWHARADGSKRWNDMKTFWAEKIRLKRITTNRAGNFGFGMNATEAAANVQQDNTFNDSVHKFSAAHNSTQAVIAGLTHTNQQMQQANAGLQQQMAYMMSNMQNQQQQQQWNGNNGRANNNNRGADRGTKGVKLNSLSRQMAKWAKLHFRQGHLIHNLHSLPTLPASSMTS